MDDRPSRQTAIPRPLVWLLWVLLLGGGATIALLWPYRWLDAADFGPQKLPWLVFHCGQSNPRRGHVVALDAGTTRLQTADGRESSLPAAYHWLREGVVPPRFPTGPQMITAAGDRLVGQCRGLAQDRLVWQLAVTPPTEPPWPVPFAAVQAAWLTSLPPDLPLEPPDYPWLRQQRNRDVLLLRNGDYLAGTLLEVTAGAGDATGTPWQLQVAPEQVRRFASAQVAAILFNPALVRRRPRPEPLLLVTLDDGSRLHLARFRLDDGLLRGTTLWGAATVIPWQRVALACLLSSSLPRLTDLRPEQVEQQPYLEATVPPGFNRTAEGRELPLPWQGAVATADWGLTLTPRTTLRYRLPARFRRLEMWVALHPHASPHARARLRILAGDQPVPLPGAGLCSAGPARFWSILLPDVRHLTVVADFPAEGEPAAPIICAWPRLIP